MSGSKNKSNTLLVELDEIIDAEFNTVDIPHEIYDIAVRYMLLFYEDYARLAFDGTIDYSLYEIMMKLDQHKYSLKHCFLKILSNARKEKVSIQSRVSGDLYKKSSNFLYAGLQYDILYRTLGSAFKGAASVERIDGDYIAQLVDSEMERYALLEMIGHGCEPEPDIVGLLYHWLRSENNEAQFIRQSFCNVSRLKNRIIIYRYDDHLLDHISRKIPQRALIIPEEFEFLWGSAEQTQALINSLMIRCLYHVMSVNCYAQKVGLKGGGVESILLEISQSQLCEDIQLFADFDLRKINAFIDFLTYGNNTITPDPALQPLFKLSSGKSIIPCILVLTNNLQRNVMCLYARLQSKDFDRQSKYLEAHMIKDLIPYLEKFDFKNWNISLNVGGESEEIDILLLDTERSTILVVELRAMLQPGDVREVSDRSKVCQEKVTQLDRKVQFVRRNTEAILKSYFPNAKFNQNDVSVNGVVVLKGYGGQPSQVHDLPITTAEIFQVGLQHTSNLDVLHQWLADREWLPLRGKHFVSDNDVVELKSCSVTRPIIRIIAEPDGYQKYVRDTIMQKLILKA